MILKLTALHYKIKTDALERFHNINFFAEQTLAKWEDAFAEARNLNQDIPQKPFIEPFEYINDDYDVTDRKFRVRAERIKFYKQNLDNLTEVTLDKGETFVIRETVEQLDELLGV